MKLSMKDSPDTLVRRAHKVAGCSQIALNSSAPKYLDLRRIENREVEIAGFGLPLAYEKFVVENSGGECSHFGIGYSKRV